MGTKGNNQKSYAFYEELPYLRVTPDAEIPYIYKRLDVELSKPVEQRKYQIRIPKHSPWKFSGRDSGL